MRHHSILVVVFALLGATNLSAQRVLPDRIGPLVAYGPAQTDKEEYLTFENAHSDLLKESSVVATEHQTYAIEAANSDTHFNLTLYRAKDPSGAHELFTAIGGSASDLTTIDLGENSRANHDSAVIQIGNLVLYGTHLGGRAGNELRPFVDRLSPLADKTPLPPIRSYLPQDGARSSTRYALGPAGFRAALADLRREGYAALADEAGFNSGAEAMFAQYRKGKEDAVLLLIEYPTPQLAGLHLKHLEQALSPEAKAAGTTIERKASLLSIVLAPSSPEYAQQLRSAVNYETEVTWNEPTHTITDPPILTTVAKIILSTGVFMVVAFVLGVAFGGVRVLTKIFFPGKVFDRPEQMDVLQLGLSSKRINSRDFY